MGKSTLHVPTTTIAPLPAKVNAGARGVFLVFLQIYFSDRSRLGKFIEDSKFLPIGFSRAMLAERLT